MMRGLISPGPLAGAPWLLGDDLLAWWDADHAALITKDGSNLVSAHADAVAGYTLTATSTAQPTFGLTSFNGTPGITYDGTANCMEMTAGIGWLPIGAAGSEDWYLLEEVRLASDTATRFFGAWGNSNSICRRVGSIGETTAVHCRVSTGNGASAVSHTGSTELFGRHVVRGVTEPTQSWSEVDGVASTPTAVVPASTAPRLRTGANANDTAANFGKFVFKARVITKPLTVAKANMLRAFLSRRL